MPTLPDNMPNFFILGAAKAGTTSLYHYLKQHPDVFMSAEKEPHFFDNDKHFGKGLEFYLNEFFQNANGYAAKGEATPSYLSQHKKTIPRMKGVYSTQIPKFIIILRDPVKRAWSHYLHCVRISTERETFEKSILLEKDRLKKNENEWVGYFRDGLYASQLKAWLNHFPEKNFFFVLNDDLRKHPNLTLKNIFKFLGIDSNIKIERLGMKNIASAPRFKFLMDFFAQPSIVKKPFKYIISSEIRRKIVVQIRRKNLKPNMNIAELPTDIENNLRKKYLPDILELEQLIGKDLSTWKGFVE